MMPQRRQVLHSMPGALFCLLVIGLLSLVSACGGSSTPTNSGTTPTAVVSNPTSGTTDTPVTSSPTSGTSPTATTSTGGTTPTATTAPGVTPTPTQVFQPTPTPTPRPTPRPTPTPTPRPTPTPTPPPTVVVVISTTNKGVFFFSPKVINVTRGTIVLWRNETQVPHTVTGSSFGSGIINSGGTYSFQFTAPGSYGYHCAIHPYMLGTVNVS